MAVNEGSLFAKPAAEWTDEELRVGAVQAALRRNELAAAGESEQAEFLNDLCVELVEERDRRAALRREVEDAMITSVDITDTLEQDPPDLERERRLSVATAEWQAGKAELVERPRLICRAGGNTTSARLYRTSVGLLFTARAPLPSGYRSTERRKGDFATLLDAGGGVDVECTRCEGRHHFDLDEIRRGVQAGVKVVLAT